MYGSKGCCLEQMEDLWLWWRIDLYCMTDREREGEREGGIEREREREGGRGREREGEREGER